MTYRTAIAAAVLLFAGCGRSEEAPAPDVSSWVMTEEKYTAGDLEAYFHEKGAETFDFRTAPNSFIFE